MNDFRCKWEHSIEFVLVYVCVRRRRAQGLQRDHKHIEESSAQEHLYLSIDTQDKIDTKKTANKM